MIVTYSMLDNSTGTRASNSIGRGLCRASLCLAMMFGSATLLLAQRPDAKIFYFPKPVQPTPYVAPMKPFLRLADLKAQHKGQVNWTVLVVDDKFNRAE